jgi:hypothetical protein
MTADRDQTENFVVLDRRLPIGDDTVRADARNSTWQEPSEVALKTVTRSNAAVDRRNRARQLSRTPRRQRPRLWNEAATATQSP